MEMKRIAIGSPDSFGRPSGNNQSSNMTFNNPVGQNISGVSGSPQMDPSSTSDFFQGRNPGYNEGLDDLHSAQFASRSVTNASPVSQPTRGQNPGENTQNAYNEMYNTTYNQTKKRLQTFSSQPQAILDSNYAKLKSVEDYRNENRINQPNAFDSMADRYGQEDGTYNGFEYMRARYYHELDNPPTPDRSRSVSPLSQGRMSVDPSRKGGDNDTYGIRVSPADDDIGSPVLDYAGWQTTTVTTTKRRAQGSPDQYGRGGNDPANTSFGNSTDPAQSGRGINNGPGNPFNQGDNGYSSTTVSKKTTLGQEGLGPNRSGEIPRDQNVNELSNILGQNDNGLNRRQGLPGDQTNNITTSTNTTKRTKRGHNGMNNDFFEGNSKYQSDPDDHSANFGLLRDGFDNSRDAGYQNNDDQIALDGIGQTRGISRNALNSANTNQRDKLGMPDDGAGSFGNRRGGIEGYYDGQSAGLIQPGRHDQMSNIQRAQVNKKAVRGQPGGNQMDMTQDYTINKGTGLQEINLSKSEAPQSNAKNTIEIDYETMERLENNLKNTQNDIRSKEIEAEMIDRLNDTEAERRRIIQEQLLNKQEMMKAEAERNFFQTINKQREEEIRKVTSDKQKNQSSAEKVTNKIVSLDSRMRKINDKVIQGQQMERESREKSISNLESKIFKKIQEVLDAQANGKISPRLDNAINEDNRLNINYQGVQKIKPSSPEIKKSQTNTKTVNHTNIPTTSINKFEDVNAIKKRVIAHAESKDVSDDTKDVFMRLSDGRLGRVVATREYSNRSNSPVPRAQTSISPVPRIQTSNSPVPRFLNVESNSYQTHQAYNTVYQGGTNSIACASHGAVSTRCQHVCKGCGINMQSNLIRNEIGTYPSPQYLGASVIPQYSSLNGASLNYSSTSNFPQTSQIPISSVASGIHKIVVNTPSMSKVPVTIRSTTPPSKIAQLASPTQQTMPISQTPTQYSLNSSSYKSIPAHQTINVHASHISTPSYHSQTMYSNQQYGQTTIGSTAPGRSTSPMVNRQPANNEMSMADILNEVNKNFSSYKPRPSVVSGNAF